MADFGMTLHTTTDHVRLACGDVMDWREVVDPGTVKLSHVDGPYDMRKADWDCLTGARVGFPERLAVIAQRYPNIPEERIEALGGYIAALTVLDPRGADLAAWYAPVLAEVSAASALSSSVYLWNTDAGEALLRPVMQALGWTRRSRIVWDKMTPPSLLEWRAMGEFPDATEVCGVWTRGGAAVTLPGPITNVWQLSGKALSLEQMKRAPQPHRGGKGKDAGLVVPSLHPCQKPLDFAERILRASSNPGDLVVDWFAGTSRLAVANVQRLDRAERRDVVSIEADARWLDAVAPALSAEASLASLGTVGAPSLFCGAS